MDVSFYSKRNMFRLHSQPRYQFQWVSHWASLFRDLSDMPVHVNAAMNLQNDQGVSPGCIIVYLLICYCTTIVIVLYNISFITSGRQFGLINEENCMGTSVTGFVFVVSEYCQ